MAATLNIINNAILVNGGQVVTAKQGNLSALVTDPQELGAILASLASPVTLLGTGAQQVISLATATAVKIYDSSVAGILPATFRYFHVVSDQPVYLQIIGSATNAQLQILPKIPFTLSYDGILGVAATTPIANGATPSLTAIATMYIGNVSGATANIVVSAFA